jgi:outer membrane protein OmpA-like peptidoglycan-associated protein
MTTTSYASAAVGPRLHVGGTLFGARTHHDAWLDAHGTYGSSGGIRRPGFDVGAAVQWEVSPAVRLGPMVRWSFGSDPLDQNAQVLTVGLALGVGGRTRQTIHVEGDADGDGLIDSVDECPGEHPGDRPDAGHPGCPVRDADGDGVLDEDDECEDEPAGDRPDVDRLGCPLPPIVDGDEDGVPDDDDRCPEVPGAVRPGEPTNGCPLARVQDKKIEILEQIFFEHDSATISESSQPVLEAIGKVIAELDGARISIEGHTSEDGSDSHNMDLSKRRARAVAQWLIENAGIAATRLDVKGWGKRRPLVSGVGADTSKNRRVEFLILEGR